YLFFELLEPAAAVALFQRPVLNGGVIAAAADSPVWPRWQQLLEILYKRARVARIPDWEKPPAAKDSNGTWKGEGVTKALFHADEVALNAVSYLQVGNPAILSARYNWLCNQAIPMQDDQGFFVDTTWPHERIGVIHMAAHTKDGRWKTRTL